MTFDAFISQKLLPELCPGAVVVMDNCSIHKSDEIEALIQSCWSKIKGILRTIGARTYGDLLTALETAFLSVTQKDLLGWFTYCCYCTEED